MILSRTLLRSIAVAAIALLAPVAIAQPAASDDDKRAAKELANKGYELYEAGKYAEALPFFRKAEAKFPAPTILLVEARAQEQIGGFVEAQGLYQRIVDMTLAEDAPKEFVDAQATAKDALPAVSGKIAFVKIVLKGMTADKVRVTIDDVEIPADRMSKPVPANPGARKIVATIGGEETGRSVFQQVTLKEGVTKQIQLVFRPGGTLTSGELPPSGGGCASCEIGGRDRAAGEREALFAGLAAAALLGARRRRTRTHTR